MEFCLHYEGKLRSRDTAKAKHSIRQSLHGQLRSICLSRPFVSLFKPDQFESLVIKDLSMSKVIDGKKFNFLISEKLATVANLNLTLLVPHAVGSIVQNGGDIDNRLKTLFDALRIPTASSEVPTTDDFEYGSEGMYCLLEDDKLINRVAIKSFQDHSPLGGDSVRCLIEVETKITQPVLAGLCFV